MDTAGTGKAETQTSGKIEKDEGWEDEALVNGVLGRYLLCYLIVSRCHFLHNCELQEKTILSWANVYFGPDMDTVLSNFDPTELTVYP